VPIDGAAPENLLGRGSAVLPLSLIGQSGVPCVVPGPNPGPICVQHVPAVGAGGRATPLANFLGISSVPVPGPNNDHFDRNPIP
jgi:hypothetical protein